MIPVLRMLLQATVSTATIDGSARTKSLRTTDLRPLKHLLATAY